MRGHGVSGNGVWQLSNALPPGKGTVYLQVPINGMTVSLLLLRGPAAHVFCLQATPSFLTDPHDAKTEDDVLHIRNLPSFDDALGQRDSELLISYLTVPYLRLPLVMSFFSTQVYYCT